MEAKTMSRKMEGILVLYDMHTGFFPNVIEGISEKDARERLDKTVNHMSWITGSMVEGRFDLARSFGIQEHQKESELFKDNQGLQEGGKYPALAAYEQDWKRITPLLREAMLKADDKKLEELYEMPGMKISLFDVVAFTTYREANCIGQLALWRRLLGYPAMKYM